MNFFLLIFFIVIVTFAYGYWRGAPWVPTRAKDVERFIRLAAIKKGDVVYDLGCGDGRLLLAAARQGAKVKGWELSLLPYLLAHIKRYFEKNSKDIRIIYGDYWNQDLSGADVIYLFLSPQANIKLKDKLERECKNGVKIIAYVWPIIGWEPKKIDTAETSAKIYLYLK